MFTYADLRSLLDAKPFIPFRLRMSDGGTVEVQSRELVFPGRRLAVIGLLDPDAKDTIYDRFTTISYMHITRAEQLHEGTPPFSSPPEPPTVPASP